jgi:hypothetical protein
MIIKFHVSVKSQGAVAVGSSDVLDVVDSSCQCDISLNADQIIRAAGRGEYSGLACYTIGGDWKNRALGGGLMNASEQRQHDEQIFNARVHK